MNSGSDSKLATLYIRVRVWLEQRAERRQSLRAYRLAIRAERRLRS